MIDLTIPGAARLLADRVQAAVEDTTALPGKHSWRIKVSALGGECVAKQWYAFRWVAKRDIPGKLARIFDDGNVYEPRIVDWLKRSGWMIEDKDPSKIGTRFEQWNFKALDGHISAFLDGIGSHPEFTQGVRILVEAKSYNKRRFGLLVGKKSVKAADYEYYTQICCYMEAYNLPYCVFFCVCKDDADLYVEIVPRDPATAERALRIATTVKDSRARPGRVAETPSFHICKHCDFVGVCHLGETPERNCRSCVNAVPIAGGKFGCMAFNEVIPNEKHIIEFALTCPHYQAIQ